MLLLAIFFFAITGLLMAQSSQSQSAKPSPGATQTGNLPWDMSSMTGCLQSSKGVYTLVEEDGTAHELSGASGKLKREVGHEVEVIGKTGSKTVDNTAPGGASSVIMHEVFEVKSVRQVAAKCKTAD